ncbi:hypothetical protein ACFPTO_11825 [Paraburkholderia denitrificans]|uniref:Uncharacterized protein n=1 Tax=Paraburkholderia denitrificans TaxID=694025 RepID=A0ABW0J8U0_9BURK
MPIHNSSARLTDDQEKIFRTQIWSYFALHAAQRMQSFQFYITLETALVGGAILLAKSDGSHQCWIAVIGAVVSLLSFVFWKLDGRTRLLIKNAELALNYLDDQHNLPNVNSRPHPLRLFKNDEVANSPTSHIWNIRLSYSNCFNIVFAIFGIGGAGFALTLALLV